MSDFIAQYDDNETKPNAEKTQNKVEKKIEVPQPMDESDVIEAEKKAEVAVKTSTENPIEEAARGQGWVLQKEWD